MSLYQGRALERTAAVDSGALSALIARLAHGAMGSHERDAPGQTRLGA